MNNETPKTPKPAGEFDLGTWLGRRQAFSIVAGKASASDIECLRQIRDQKLYKSRTANWSDFCDEYVGASKSHVDSEIRYLLKYGPQYFELAKITRIPRDAYRAIADHVTSNGVELDGEVIPLVTENSQRLAAAVAALRRRAAIQASKALPSAEPADVFPAIEKRLERMIADIGALPPFENYDGRSLALVELLEKLKKAAKEKGAPIDL